MQIIRAFQFLRYELYLCAFVEASIGFFALRAHLLVANMDCLEYRKCSNIEKPQHKGWQPLYINISATFVKYVMPRYG